MARLLCLHASGQQSGHEVLLRKEKHEVNRQGRGQRRGHQKIPVNFSLVAEARQRHLHGLHRVAACGNQRPRVFIPRARELQNAQRRQHRPAQGQIHAQICAKPAAAVHHRRVVQLLRKRHVELPRQEHAERTGDKGNDQSRVGIDQPGRAAAEKAHLLKQREHGNQRHLRGNHHAQQNQHKQRVPSAKRNAREHIAGHRVDHQRNEHRDHRHISAVQKIPSPVAALHGNAIVLKPQLRRDDHRVGGVYLVHRLKRHGHGHEHRKRHQQAQNQHKQKRNQTERPVSARSLHPRLTSLSPALFMRKLIRVSSITTSRSATAMAEA